MTTRSRNAAISAATVAFIVFAGWFLLGWGGPVVSAVGSMASAAFAMACAVIAGRRGHGRQRTSWLLFSVGLAGWLIGNTIWAHYLVVLHVWPPFPSAADAFYLMLPLSTCAAAVFAPSAGWRAGVRILLDGILVAGSIFLIAWTAGLHTLHDSGDAHGLTSYCRSPTRSPTWRW